MKTKKLVFRISNKIVSKREFVKLINSGWVLNAEMSPYFKKKVA